MGYDEKFSVLFATERMLVVYNVQLVFVSIA